MESSHMEKFRRPTDEPASSETTLLFKVEDLIGLTFGTGETNIINLKILQTILHVLASKMRMLEQDVEIRFVEEDEILTNLKKEFTEQSPELITEQKPVKDAQDDTDTAKTDEKTDKIEKGKLQKKGRPKSADKKGKQKKGAKPAVSSSTKLASRGSMEVLDSQTRIASIEVVTASKFDLLDSTIQKLLKKTGGVPLPEMPSNEELLAELAKGTASLPDTMEAMQANARLRAVEHAITKMAGLLTQLASSGALPKEVAAIITQMQKDLQQLALITGIEPEPPKPAKSVTIAASSSASTSKGRVKRGKGSKSGVMSTASVGVSTISAVAAASVPAMPPPAVTHHDMHQAMDTMRDDLLKAMTMLATKSESNCDQASRTVKAVSDKMDIALNLDNRINTIQSMTADYLQQLHGFEAGLGLQLQNFREQMGQLRNELAGGLVQLEAANSNSESAALIDLKSNYANLMEDHDHTLNNQNMLVELQKNLTNELKQLIECVELLREQKADCDEVADGLRDKANMSRLKGLLRQPQFEDNRNSLEKRLKLSYDKFLRQEQVWTTVLEDLNALTASKASILDLWTLKDCTAQTLSEHWKVLEKLEFALGEPKTALLTRKLADAQSKPCLLPSLMEEKASHVPPKLPPLRRGNDKDEICIRAPIKTDTDADKRHACQRWVGGSHTLLSDYISREHATPALTNQVPTKQYTGIGSDGRLYFLEEELQPCIECNKISPTEGAPPPSEDGGGDIA